MSHDQIVRVERSVMISPHICNYVLNYVINVFLFRTVIFINGCACI